MPFFTSALAAAKPAKPAPKTITCLGLNVKKALADFALNKVPAITIPLSFKNDLREAIRITVGYLNVVNSSRIYKRVEPECDDKDITLF
jgi:hypothetical protein